MTRYLWVAALCALSALGADVTGKWAGAFDMTRNGETRNDTALLELKQEGTKITGTVGPNADQRFPITSGTITGSKISIQAGRPGGDATEVMVFALTLAGDRLTGDVKAPADGSRFTAKIDVKREK